MLRPIANPPSRFDAHSVALDIPAALAKLTVFEDDSKSILAHNDSPDLWHRWSLNPYRGCMHACAYCYARPTHEYLGFGAGTDHDTKILVKPRAAALLGAQLDHPSWVGETTLFSGNTDCYQALEHRWRLTRACLEVCLAYRNPVVVITKSALVERDADLLAGLARDASVRVVFSIPFWDPATARAIEPGTPSPQRRVEAMRALHQAGVPVSVNVAPVIPGLNDRDIPAIIAACADAGAAAAAMILVRLPGPVEQVFADQLRATLPTRAEGVLARLRRARGGALNDPRFGSRMTGDGAEWAATKRLFQLSCKKHGIRAHDSESMSRDAQDGESPFRRPGAGVQVKLFG